MKSPIFCQALVSGPRAVTVRPGEVPHLDFVAALLIAAAAVGLFLAVTDTRLFSAPKATDNERLRVACVFAASFGALFLIHFALKYAALYVVPLCAAAAAFVVFVELGVCLRLIDRSNSMLRRPRVPPA